MKNVYVLDTNTFLSDPFVARLLTDQPSETILLKCVFEQLDTLKTEETHRGFQAREASRELEQMTKTCPRVNGGWQWEENPENFFIIDERTDRQVPGIDRSNVDDRILASTQAYQRKAEKTGDQVYLVTNDRNLRILAANRGVPTIDPVEFRTISPGCYTWPLLGKVIGSGNTQRTVYDVELDGEKGLIALSFHQHGTQPAREVVALEFDVNATNRSGNGRGKKYAPILIMTADMAPTDVEKQAVFECSKKISLNPRTQAEILYYRGWKLKVTALHGRTRDDPPLSRYPVCHFDRLGLSFQFERMNQDEQTGWEAYCQEQEQAEQLRAEQDAAARREQEALVEQQAQEAQARRMALAPKAALQKPAPLSLQEQAVGLLRRYVILLAKLFLVLTMAAIGFYVVGWGLVFVLQILAKLVSPG